MSTLHRTRCLVAEDQALIGMAIEAYLEEVGIEVAGPFSSCTSALDWAQGETPDLALLDYKLRDGLCIELARTLIQRGVPVVFYSGLPRTADIPSDLRDVIWIEKPADRDSLLDVLVCLADAGSASAFHPPVHCSPLAQ
jgi:DNA-binding response OmpR family regulator